MMRVFIGYKAWKDEEYLLNRTTFKDNFLLGSFSIA